MTLQTYRLEDIEKGMRILFRADLNVPILDGVVQSGDVGRIARVSLEIKALCDRGARVVVMSHLGRPDGRVEAGLSMGLVAKALGDRVGRDVRVAPGVVGDDVEEVVRDMEDGEVLMLENLRFDPREKGDDEGFARELAGFGDVYINSAFGVSHRAHASVHAVAGVMPAFAGRLVEEEMRELGAEMMSPSLLVSGGLKLKTKVPLLEGMKDKVDEVLVGGRVALPLMLVVHGKEGLAADLGLHAEEIDAGRKVLKALGEKLVIPEDVRVLQGGEAVTIQGRDVSSDSNVVDIGEETERVYREKILAATSMIWNGPMGRHEMGYAERGTIAVAEAVRDSDVRAVIGGADTVGFLEKRQLIDSFSFVSTGGGAMLEYLSGGVMPGLEVLQK